MGEMENREAGSVTFDENAYKPLPDSLQIANSDVHGQGLFAREDIPIGTDLGLSHVFVMHDWNGKIWAVKYWERTPLGGFINHSETPNVHVEVEGPNAHFFTLRDIKIGEELFTQYEEGYEEKLRFEFEP
jgi:hypothetical protein